MKTRFTAIEPEKNQGREDPNNHVAGFSLDVECTPTSSLDFLILPESASNSRGRKYF